ncbi:molybdopterin converting factor subunit 1 [Neptunicella sp. SCSIO 80796]|uniref:molybdopterin converting factor subunit 1 n=1 Tax=Neptunicella plasticusilytica TaxID=3117012 RepID=UPI003A4E4902
MIKIKFFAQLRERLDCEQLEWSLSNSATVGQVRQQLVEQQGKWLALQEGEVLCALNHTIVGLDTAVQAGDELAFFPPVTGG